MPLAKFLFVEVSENKSASVQLSGTRAQRPRSERYDIGIGVGGQIPGGNRVAHHALEEADDLLVTSEKSFPPFRRRLLVTVGGDYELGWMFSVLGLGEFAGDTHRDKAFARTSTKNGGFFQNRVILFDRRGDEREDQVFLACKVVVERALREIHLSRDFFHRQPGCTLVLQDALGDCKNLFLTRGDLRLFS